MPSIQLGNHSLHRIPAGIQQPSYDRCNVVPSIVHLGMGAFHRAHQAAMTEAVLNSGDLNWGIVGAGLKTASTKNALAPQDDLYTLAERGAGSEKLRVIGAIKKLYGGEHDRGQVLASMMDARTRIVSLTVTEKAYYLSPASAELQLQDPVIQADLASPENPQTVLGLIVLATKHRKAHGLSPFTVLSCDNMPSNGKITKAAVVAFANELDPKLAAWIDANVCFPSTMVDRITPATTDEDRKSVCTQLGLADAWPVVTEQFTQWVIEDNFSMGRPDWTLGGAVFSHEIEAWEHMKLRCLNGAHSTLSYLGQLVDCETVAEAMQNPFIVSTLDDLWDEIMQVLKPPQEVNVRNYVEQLKQRFRNPTLHHRTAQIAMDGSQKLPLRLLSTLRERVAAGLPSPAIAMSIAAWMHYVMRTAYATHGILNDPMSSQILTQAKITQEYDAAIENLLSLERIFGKDLQQHSTFRGELLAAYSKLGHYLKLAN